MTEIGFNVMDGENLTVKTESFVKAFDTDAGFSEPCELVIVSGQK